MKKKVLNTLSHGFKSIFLETLIVSARKKLNYKTFTKKGGIVLEYDYRLKGKGATLKVKVVAVETWHVVAIRSDNGEEDKFPLPYFQTHFIEI